MVPGNLPDPSAVDSPSRRAVAIVLQPLARQRRIQSWIDAAGQIALKHLCAIGINKGSAVEYTRWCQSNYARFGVPHL